MSYELGFAVFYVFIYLFIYFLILTVFNYVCVSAFEQGHLDPWRSKSALIIIIIIFCIYLIFLKSVYRHLYGCFQIDLGTCLNRGYMIFAYIKTLDNVHKASPPVVA